jgi:transposase
MLPGYGTIGLVTTHDALPDDIGAPKSVFLAEREARRQAEARVSCAEAMVAHLKLLIVKLRREQYGRSSERGRQMLDQLELQLEGLEADGAETKVAGEVRMAEAATAQDFPRRRPVRGPLPEHLPRERVVIPVPSACPCCGGKLAKLGESSTSPPSRPGSAPARRRWSRWSP